MEKNVRLLWADSLKGCLIVLVVLGHAIKSTIGDCCYDNHLWNFIYSFHMPAFMAISGYLSYRPDKNRKDVFPFIFRRFRQLLIPYFLWTVISLLIDNRLTIENLKSYFLYPDMGLWFLWALFFISVIFLLGKKVALGINIKEEYITLFFCVVFVVSMVLFDVRILGFQFIAYYFIFYSLGYYIKKYYNRVVIKNKAVTVFLAIFWIILAWFWKMHETPVIIQSLPLPAVLAQYSYRFITAVIAVYFLFIIAPSILSNQGKWNIPFVQLGQISLGIYAVHLNLVRSFTCLALNTSFVVLIAFICGVMGSWLIVYLLSKWKYTSMLLLGKV